MLSFRALLVSCILASALNFALGLRCYSCNSVDSNSKCSRSVLCRGGSNGCENVVRLENGLVRISKRCQQFDSCRANSRQNYNQCRPSVKSMLQSNRISANRNAPPSVCRSCCNTDNCNEGLFLQEESRTGYRNPTSPVRWRPAQPSIRDVAVSVLTPETALITFRDVENHTADFFDVRLIPTKSVRVAPVIVYDNTVPGLNLQVPDRSLAYLVRGLSAGTQYRISVVSRDRNSLYSQRIYNNFVTKPRRPSALRLESFDVDKISVFVGASRRHYGDRVSFYSLSYRRASDPPSAARRIPNFNRAGVRAIPDLAASTEYIISAWTTVSGANGRPLASSEAVNLTVFTAVPGIAEVTVTKVHSTNITWAFRLPRQVTTNSQEHFIVRVRDDTHGAIVIDTVLAPTRRSFIARALTPQTAYTFSIRARAVGRNSVTAYSTPVFTLLRCFSCYDAMSRQECDQFVECPADAGGCLNEIRRRSFSGSNTFNPNSYRATLKCKQVRACNNSELQDMTMQCNPDLNRHDNPPDVCRCCCEGDLCNGPGSTCGHILGWLEPFRTPERSNLPTIAFCPARNEIDNGAVTCTSENEIGSTCSFTCSEDYYLLGVESTTCFDGGEWSDDVPQCLPIRICPAIEPSEGTIVRCSDGFKAGSRCRISCEIGYLNAGGANTVRCARSGKWSLALIPVCLQEDDCQPNPCVNQATCYDLSNDFECECVPGWTGKICDELVFCEVLEVPENGLLECTDTNNYRSRCRYACDDGYEQHGSTYTRCLADGYWSAFEPTLCVVQTCEVPSQRLINGGRTECTGFEFGDTCEFTCPAGLSVAGGPANITCESDTLWSDNVPCCDLKCPPHVLVDLYLLLDSSTSVGRQNWRILINFTIALLDQFVVGPDDMRVGVGRYNRRFDRRSEIQIGEYEDYNDLKRKIRAIPYNGQGTKTGSALWHVHRTSLNAPGNRPGVADIVLVITDGKASDNVARPAKAIREDRETKIYVVGVINRFNNINYTQLASISSGPGYLQIIKDGYEELARNLSATLTDDVCWIPCEFEYEKRDVLLRQRQLMAMREDELDAQFWETRDLNTTYIDGDIDDTNSRLIDPFEIDEVVINEEPNPIELEEPITLKKSGA